MRLRAPERFQIYASGVITERGVSPDGGGDALLAETTAVCALARDFSVLISDRMGTAAGKVGDVVVRSHYLRGHERAGRRVLDIARDALEIFY